MNDFRVLVDEMKVRGFSRKTIKCYLHINNRFLEFIKKSKYLQEGALPYFEDKLRNALDRKRN